MRWETLYNIGNQKKKESKAAMQDTARLVLERVTEKQRLMRSINEDGHVGDYLANEN